ncbi:MAG: hypothetical protein QM673_17555 [Gordonia sp. (in: high G+C Gram-positive bacteria)]
MYATLSDLAGAVLDAAELSEADRAHAVGCYVCGDDRFTIHDVVITAKRIPNDLLDEVQVDVDDGLFDSPDTTAYMSEAIARLRAKNAIENGVTTTKDADHV